MPLPTAALHVLTTELNKQRPISQEHANIADYLRIGETARYRKLRIAKHTYTDFQHPEHSLRPHTRHFNYEEARARLLEKARESSEEESGEARRSPNTDTVLSPQLLNDSEESKQDSSERTQKKLQSRSNDPWMFMASNWDRTSSRILLKNELRCNKIPDSSYEKIKQNAFAHSFLQSIAEMDESSLSDESHFDQFFFKLAAKLEGNQHPMNAALCVHLCQVALEKAQIEIDRDDKKFRFRAMKAEEELLNILIMTDELVSATPEKQINLSQAYIKKAHAIGNRWNFEKLAAGMAFLGISLFFIGLITSIILFHAAAALVPPIFPLVLLFSGLLQFIPTVSLSLYFDRLSHKALGPKPELAKSMKDITLCFFNQGAQQAKAAPNQEPVQHSMEPESVLTV